MGEGEVQGEGLDEDQCDLELLFALELLCQELDHVVTQHFFTLELAINERAKTLGHACTEPFERFHEDVFVQEVVAWLCVGASEEEEWCWHGMALYGMAL